MKRTTLLCRICVNKLHSTDNVLQRQTNYLFKKIVASALPIIKVCCLITCKYIQS